jgi:hypothetical protein
MQKVEEVFKLLGRYATMTGSYRRFGTAYRPRFVGTCSPLYTTGGLTAAPKRRQLPINAAYKPKKQRPHSHGSGSLK